MVDTWNRWKVLGHSRLSEGPHPLACFLPLQLHQLQPPELGAAGGREAAPRVPQPRLLQSLEISPNSSPDPERVSSVNKYLPSTFLSVQRSGTTFQQKQKTDCGKELGACIHTRTHTSGPRGHTEPSPFLAERP